MAGLVLGLTQVAKVTVGINKRFVPLTALLLSLVVFYLYAYLNKVPLDWTLVSTAIITALSSVGLWSSAKNTIQ